MIKILPDCAKNVSAQSVLQMLDLDWGESVIASHSQLPAFRTVRQSTLHSNFVTTEQGSHSLEQVDETTTIGQLGPKGVDKHSFTRYVVQILRDLAEQRGDDDDASAAHAQMIFVGLPEWLAEYLQATAGAKRTSSGLIGMAGRLPKPQPVWGAVWSGSSRGADQFNTAEMAQQLVLMLAASASGIEGLLHAGLAQVLAEEIGTAPPELTGAVLAAAAMVLKYHHECTGAVEAARVASVGGPGYSKLVDAAGTAVQNEVAALVEDIKGGQKETDYTAAAEELARLSLFSEIFVETVAMKLLPALNGMIQSDHAELVSRASKVAAVVCEDSPDLGSLLCSAGLLETVVRCLTPMRRFQNAVVNHRSAQDAFVSPKTRLYLLEILSTISLPKSSKSPYSILLRSISSWPAVGPDGKEQARGSCAKMSLNDLLDDLTKAFRVEAERSKLALGPLAHFVTVISFMVLVPNMRSLIAERADLLELLLAHCCINTIGVLAVVAVLDSEPTGCSREGALWALRRIPSLECAIEDDPSVSLQVAVGLGFLVAQPEFVVYVLGMELVPVLLSFLKEQHGPDFIETRRESVRVLNELLHDTSLQWKGELADLRADAETAVATAGFIAEELGLPGSLKERQTAKLPHGWEEKESATTGERYYFNVATGESQWETPRSAWVNSEVRDNDSLEEAARDVSSGDTEDESEEESLGQVERKRPKPEVSASVVHSNSIPRAFEFHAAIANAAGEQARHGRQNNEDSLKVVAAAKQAQQAAEAETVRLKKELAALRREQQAQEATEAEVARLMAEEAAAAKRAQQAAEMEAARLMEELTAARRAQHAAEAETARIQSAAAQRATTARSVQCSLADECGAVVPLHKYKQLQQLVASLEQRITSLEAPRTSMGEEGNSVESHQEGMSLHDFLLRYRLESFETGLTELGVVVPEHLCDVDETDLESMGMKRLEIVRFRTACDLLGELDDL